MSIFSNKNSFRKKVHKDIGSGNLQQEWIQNGYTT